MIQRASSVIQQTLIRLNTPIEDEKIKLTQENFLALVKKTETPLKVATPLSQLSRNNKNTQKMYTDSLVEPKFVNQMEEDSIKMVVRESAYIPKLEISHETTRTQKSNLPDESMYILHRQRYQSWIDIDQTCLGIHKSRYRKYNLKQNSISIEDKLDEIVHIQT